MKAIKNARDTRQHERWETCKASMRAKVEHPFRVIKRQFGYTKVRCCGLAQNTAQVLTLCALSNVWMTRRQLLPAKGLICFEARDGAFRNPQTTSSGALPVTEARCPLNLAVEPRYSEDP
mgnify:CR=1 FL=1